MTHITFHSTYDDKTGDYREIYFVNTSRSSGVGSSGNLYSVDYIGHESTGFHVNGCVATSTGKVNYNLVSRGASENLSYTVFYEIVLDFCAGTSELTLTGLEEDCRG
jgi:hypothetical protein